MAHMASQLGWQITEHERIIRAPGGGKIKGYTTEKPGLLRGAAWHLVVLDEAAQMRPEVWPKVIRPALMDTRGRALIISTPRAGWFNDLCDMAESAPEWELFHFTSYDNPFIDTSELDSIDPKNGGWDCADERTWREEYLAERLTGEGEVFRMVREAATGSPQDPVSGVDYYTFCDLAQVHDFNGICTLAFIDGKVVEVHADRWNRTTWDISKERIAAVGSRYGGYLQLDTTGDSQRDPLVRDVQRAIGSRSRCRVSGFKFTNSNKEEMVRNLCKLLEQGKITLLDKDASAAAQVQYRELTEYQGMPTSTGLTRYAAPPGKHDDMVTALMAAALMARPRRQSASRQLQRLGVI